jgi:chromosome segregation ATPase
MARTGLPPLPEFEDIANLDKRLRKVEISLGAVKDLENAFKALLNDFKNFKHNLSGELDGLGSLIKKQIATNNSGKRQIENLAAEHTKANNKINATINSITDLSNLTETIGSQLVATNSRLNELEDLKTKAKDFGAVKELGHTFKTLLQDFKAFKYTIGKELDDINILIKKQIATKGSEQAQINAINKNTTELEKRTRTLKDMDSSLERDDEKIRKDFEGLSAIIRRIDRVFNAATLNKLKADAAEAVSRAEAIEKQDGSMLSRLSKTNSALSAISSHAADIDENTLAVSKRAEELDSNAADLKELANEYRERTSELNNKVNTAINSVADLSGMTENMNSQLANAGARLSEVEALKVKVRDMEQRLGSLSQKLAYIDKVCAKTIVLE